MILCIIQLITNQSTLDKSTSMAKGHIYVESINTFNFVGPWEYFVFNISNRTTCMLIIIYINMAKLRSEGSHE
jgi:hypothetical protein